MARALTTPAELEQIDYLDSEGQLRLLLRGAKTISGEEIPQPEDTSAGIRVGDIPAHSGDIMVRWAAAMIEILDGSGDLTFSEEATPHLSSHVRDRATQSIVECNYDFANPAQSSLERAGTSGPPLWGEAGSC